LEKELMGREMKTMQQRLKMLVYGRAGVGKTCFGATFPKPLILLAEPKLLPDIFRDAVKKNQGKVIKVASYDDILLAVEFLRRDRGQSYQSVVLDSMTEMQKKHMDGILLRENKTIPEIGHWGENTNETRRVVREIAELPLHVLFVCSIREDKDEETGGMHAMPGLTGRMAGEISYYVDILGLMRVKRPAPNDPDQSVKRFITTQPGAKFDAKDGTGKMEVFMAPYFQLFYELMGWGEKKEPAKEGAQPGKEQSGESVPAHVPGSDAGQAV
jgi:nucleoside-triphosphatase THEP1